MVTPTRGDLAVFIVTKEIRVSDRDVIAGSIPDDVFLLAREKAWTKAVDQPILPHGWAILRGVSDPEVVLVEQPSPDPPWRHWSVTVRMHWLARYVGR